MAASEPKIMHFGGDSRPGSYLPVTYTFLAVGGLLLVVPTIALIAGSDYGVPLTGLGPLGLYFIAMSLFTKEVHSIELHASPREAHILVQNVVTRKKKMRHFRIPDDARVIVKEDNDGGVEVTIDGLPGYVDFAHQKRDSAGTAPPVAPLGLEDEDVEALKHIAGDKQWTAFQLTREIATFLGLKPDGEVRMAVPRKW
jgi:hypothetical protein